MRAVRRRSPPIEREMAGAAAQFNRIDQNPVMPGFTHEELEVVRPQRPLLAKSLSPRAPRLTASVIPPMKNTPPPIAAFSIFAFMISTFFVKQSRSACVGNLAVSSELPKRSVL